MKSRLGTLGHSIFSFRRFLTHALVRLPESNCAGHISRKQILSNQSIRIKGPKAWQGKVCWSFWWTESNWPWNASYSKDLEFGLQKSSRLRKASSNFCKERQASSALDGNEGQESRLHSLFTLVNCLLSALVIQGIHHLWTGLLNCDEWKSSLACPNLLDAKGARVLNWSVEMAWGDYFARVRMVLGPHAVIGDGQRHRLLYWVGFATRWV